MRNVYIDRNGDGDIIGRFYAAQYDGQEKLPETDPEVVALFSIDNVEEARREEINSERDASGLKGITIDQAKNWIDNQFASASTVAEVKSAMISVFKKMIPYLIN